MLDIRGSICCDRHFTKEIIRNSNLKMFHLREKIPWKQLFTRWKVWKNKKLSLTKINFVKSTLLSYLVKPLLSRNFCQKCVRENSRNFYTTLWILRNFCITIFWKISVKTTSLVKRLLQNWFHEIILKWYKNFVNSIMCWACRCSENCVNLL